MKPKIKKPAEELGFKPSYTPMTQEQSEMFIKVSVASESDIKLSTEKDIPFGIKILNKRIKVQKLPISFSDKALLLILIFSHGNPGKIITILIDCLTKYEGQKVSDDDIVDLYPDGFYSEKSFRDYIDNYLKFHKCKWSEIY